MPVSKFGTRYGEYLLLLLTNSTLVKMKCKQFTFLFLLFLTLNMPLLSIGQCVLDIGSDGTPEICQGDSLLLEAVSGFDHYFWSTGDTTRLIWVDEAGWYYLEAEISGVCESTDSIFVTVHPAPSIDITSNIPGFEICAGETITLTAVGSPFVQYWWSSGDTTASTTVDPEETRTYVVEAVDANGCDARDVIVVHVETCETADTCEIEIDIDGDPIVCGEDSIVLEPTNGFESYNWSTGDSVRIIWANQSGTYIVEAVDDTGCVAIDSIQITFSPETPLTLTPNPNPPEICLGDTITITASGGFADYGWNTEDTTAQIMIVPEESFLLVAEALDSNGCESRATLEISVDTACSTSIYDDIQTPPFDIYPNPVSDQLRIVWSGKARNHAELRLINMQGQIVARRTASSLETNATIKWNISTLPPGSYFLHIKGERSFFRKVLKE